MSMCRVFSCIVGRWCLLWPVCSLGKTLLAFALLISYFKTILAYYSRCLLTSYFCIPVLYDEKDILFGVSSRRSCRSSRIHSTSASSALVVGAQTWITVILNGLPWKQTEIILSLLRNKQRSFCRFWDCTQVLHFKLLFTMRATPFLLRDSCPQ